MPALTNDTQEFVTRASVHKAVISQTDWKKFQYQQMIHDQLFHSDIYSMANGPKLSHLTLHIAKYAGRLYTMFDSHHTEMLRIRRRTMCDTLAMVFSISYSLRMDLLGVALDHVRVENFQKEYVLCSGLISEAYLDYCKCNGATSTYRDRIHRAIRHLRDLAIAVLLETDANPLESFNTSLALVRSRHPFSEALTKEYDRRMALYPSPETPDSV